MPPEQKEETKAVPPEAAQPRLKADESRTDEIKPSVSAQIEDDLESYDSNPALFSDEEEENKKNPLAVVEAILNKTK